MGAAAAVRVVFVLLCGSLACTLADKHSLNYLYTMPSKDSSDRIYEFRAANLLDDKQFDSYSGTGIEGTRTPVVEEVKDMKESEWNEGTEKLKHDGQKLNNVLECLMTSFTHRASDDHVLQWRNGCEGEKHSDGSVSVLNCISEYGYDGQDLISYNWTLKKWSASVIQAKQMEEEWNSGRGENAEEDCTVCVSWLEIYLRYNITKQTPPDVYIFGKKRAKNLILTCMATGFYPKDVEVKLRKSTTSLPEHLLTSSEITPNGDGTYQLRKSVDIQEDDTAEYDCYVNHISLDRPVIRKWVRPVSHSWLRGVIAGVIAGCAVIAGLIGGIYFILKKKKIAGCVHFVIRRRCEPQMEAEHDAGDGGSRRGEEPREPNETTPILQRRDPSVRFSQLLERLTP